MSFQTDVETYFRDPQTNLLYTQIVRDTLKPPAEDLFQGFDAGVWKVDGVTMSEYESFENFGISTGSYMAAEALRYELDKAPDALESMHRSLMGLHWVFELGKQLETGFFPKVYGRRFSEETSTDQVLYACVGMEAYYPYADAGDKKIIEEMIPAMVRFWMKRDYRYHYFKIFDSSWQWPLVRFPALLRLAWEFEKDPEFMKEYKRLLPHTSLPEFCQLLYRMKDGKPTDFETANHGWDTINGADCFGMDGLQFDLLLRYDPENPMACFWRTGIRWMWEEIKNSFAEDGRCYAEVLYDFDTLKAKRTPGWSKDGTAHHGAKTSWSTWLVRQGMMALRHCPELKDEVLEKTQLVLSKIGFMDCSYYEEPERFPPEERFKTKFISGDSVANRLWAEGLYRKFMKNGKV